MAHRVSNVIGLSHHDIFVNTNPGNRTLVNTIEYSRAGRGELLHKDYGHHNTTCLAQFFFGRSGWS